MQSDLERLAGFRAPGPEEWQVFLLGIGVFWLLILSGRGIFGSRAPLPILPLLSLTVVYVFFVMGSVLAPGLSIHIPLYLLFGLACVGVFRSSRRQFLSDAFDVSVGLMMMGPLIWLALVVNQAQWDDYTHWLVSAQYLLQEGHLPTADTPVLNHSHPSYPWARAMLHAWVNSQTGSLTINVQGVFNILFASTLLLWGPVWIWHQGTIISAMEAIGSMAIVSFMVVLLSACLNNQILVSSYADPLYAICMIHLLNMLCLDDVTRGDFTIAKPIADPVILVAFMAPLAVKSSGIYFSVLAFGVVVGLQVLRQYSKADLNGLSSLLKPLSIKACYLVPALIFYLLWAQYIETQSIKTSFGLRPQSEWNFHLLPTILLSMLNEMMARPYTYLGVIWAGVLLARRHRTGNSQHMPSSIFLLVGLGFFAASLIFQILVYGIAFTAYEASRAASFNRYMAPAGMVVFSALFFVLLENFHQKTRLNSLKTPAVFLAIFFTVVIFFGDKIATAQRFGSNLEAAGRELRETLAPDTRLLILDLDGNGFEASVIRFHLGGKFVASYQSSLSFSEEITRKMLKQWAEGYDYIYMHSSPGYVAKLLKTEDKLMRADDFLSDG